MDHAQKIIAELKEKVQEYELRLMQDNMIREANTATGSGGSITAVDFATDVDMQHHSMIDNCSVKTTLEISLQALRDQIKFMTEKLIATTKELNEKE